MSQKNENSRINLLLNFRTPILDVVLHHHLEDCDQQNEILSEVVISLPCKDKTDPLLPELRVNLIFKFTASNSFVVASDLRFFENKVMTPLLLSCF